MQCNIAFVCVSILYLNHLPEVMNQILCQKRGCSQRPQWTLNEDLGLHVRSRMHKQNRSISLQAGSSSYF